MKRVLILGLVVLLVIGSTVAACSQTPEWIVYNTDNSELPHYAVIALAFDAQGNLWIGTGRFYAYGGGGLAKFDEKTWAVYTKDNSGLPGNQILALALDLQGNLWVGTEFSNGVAKFDGETWAAYTAGNSDLPEAPPPALTFDAQGNPWVGTNGGLAKFDGETWTVYNTRNSELPSDRLHGGLVFDGQGKLWRSSMERPGRCMAPAIPGCRITGSGFFSLIPREIHG